MALYFSPDNDANINAETDSKMSQSAGEDDIATNWANDPDNAQNWPITKKLYNTAVPALLCFLM
jgi:hypothetical protein